MQRFMRATTKPRTLLLTISLLWSAGCARTPEQIAAHFLASGKSFAQKKDHAAAILQFKNAVKALPTNPESLYYLALSNEAMGNSRDAVQALVRATQLKEDYLPAQLKLAELMVASGDELWAQEGRDRATRVLARHPDNAPALLILAAGDAHAADWKSAQGRLNQILSANPHDIQASIALAAVQYVTINAATAEATLQGALQRDPQQDTQHDTADARLRIALGELYAATGRFAEAEAQFHGIVERDPKNIQSWLELAEVQVTNGRMQQAEQTYKRISALSPNTYGRVYPAFLIRQGKLDSAILEFQRLLHEHPTDWSIRSSLVGSYIAANRVPEAKEILRTALDESSKDVPALLQRAQLYVRSGNYHEAEQDISRVLHYQYNSAEAHYVLAQIHGLNGENLQQKQQLGEALQFRPEYLEARIELARLLIRTGNARTALDLMGQAPAAQRRLLPVIAERNWALLARGDTAGFEQGIDEGMKQGVFAELHLQRGIYFLLKAKRADARTEFERALIINPAETRALQALAEMYAKEKQLSKAVDLVQAFASRYPRSAEIQMVLGHWLVTAGQAAPARQAFANAKALDRNRFTADLAIAQLDLSLKDYAGVRHSLSSTLADHPELTSARLMLAMADEAAGQNTDAIAGYRKVVEADPNNVVALNNLASLLSDRDDELDIALKYAQRAKELAADFAYADDTLGWVLCRKQLYRAAIPYLESAAKKRGNARVSYHLAIAYARLGDKARAQNTLKTALAADSSLPEAHLARQAVAEGRGTN